MDREKGVLAGAGAVHPVQPALDPEPGLVEPGHLAAGDLLAGLLQEPAQLLLGRPGDTAGETRQDHLTGAEAGP